MASGKTASIASKTAEAKAKAFLYMARQFQEAANELYAAHERREKAANKPANAIEFVDPIYFLLFQCMELAFKAYLRAHGQSNVKKHLHDVEGLYAACKKLGLVVGKDDRTDIGNVVGLLASGNKEQGFRYFNLESHYRPNLAWARETVDAMMEVVSAEIAKQDKSEATAATGLKAVTTFNKPVPKKSRGA